MIYFFFFFFSGSSTNNHNSIIIGAVVITVLILITVIIVVIIHYTCRKSNQPANTPTPDTTPADFAVSYRNNRVDENLDGVRLHRPRTRHSSPLNQEPVSRVSSISSAPPPPYYLDYAGESIY